MEGSGENKGLGEKMDEDEKETVDDAIKDGQDWLSSNPDADTEEIKEKQKEIEGICSPIIQKSGEGGTQFSINDVGSAMQFGVQSPTAGLRCRIRI